MEREEITIPSGGSALAAWHYHPEGSGPEPTVLLAHGFGGTRGARLDRYAERFAAAGLGAIVFDYRHFGDSDGQPRQLLSVGRQLADWQAALAHARGLPTVDPARIALWGTSFSGGHVVVTASKDPNVAAVVAQVPLADGLRTVMKLPPLSAVKVTGAALADLARSAVGGAPVPIPLVGPNGSAAAMPTPQAREGYPRLFAGIDHEDHVLARIGLRVPTYRPVRHAGRVAAPLLVQAGEDDDLTPAAAARAMADRAPQGRFSLRPTGHFDPYFPPWFDEVVDEQVDFLTECLQP